MTIIRSLPFVALLATAQGQVFLSPADDILLPPSNTASEPLKWLGGNGPYFAGPNVNGVENVVPKGCVVDQVAYVTRHGSRYPDQGAYNGWVDLYNKIQAADFAATGNLAFLKSWKPVLTNPTVQIANQSPTGWKESYDMGYRLRTKYGHLYEAGTQFYSWANLYPRVVATARNFVRGFLGENAESLGTVVTIDAKGGASVLFDSLGPSDQCPAYKDLNGGSYATQWDAIYLPPIKERLNKLITGNLVFTDAEISQFPYLCGFESQITGVLSPFCSTFTDEELRAYQYRQDLRYYYGTGPGTDLQSKMMLPFLDSLVKFLSKGPGQKGIKADGGDFDIPRILTAFANDGQMTQLVAGLGVFDDQTPLSGSEIPAMWKYMSSRFCTMRGTVAFERLTCGAGSSTPNTTTSAPSTTSTATASLCSVSPAMTTKACNRDNCFRQLLQSSSQVSEFCSTYTQAANATATTTTLPTFVSQCQGDASRVSSACSCLHPVTATPCQSSTVTATTTSSTPTASPQNKNVYLRILLNDAVYPVPGCQDGPGKTCNVDAYSKFIADKLAKAADLKARCNSTLETSGPLGGASFFRDLRSPALAFVKP